MKIQISKLREAAQRVLTHALNILLVDPYDLPIFYYWDVVSRDDRYRSTNLPGSLRAQVDVDWNHVAKITFPDPGGKVDALIQLSNLLRAVGDHVPDFISKSNHVGDEKGATIDFLQELSKQANSSAACWQHQIKYFEGQIAELKGGHNSAQIADPQKVKISTLKSVAEIILKDVLQRWHVDSYDIPQDFYWDFVGSARVRSWRPSCGNFGKFE